MKILKENLSIEILNEMLKNLEPNFAKKLLDILLKTPDRNDFSKSHIRKIWYELSEHPGKSFGQNSPSYWTLRGWSIEDANCKRKQFQKSVPNMSPFATKTYENMINPKTGLIFTTEEIVAKIKSLRPINKEYWIAKGFNDEDAMTKVSEVQKNASHKSLAKFRAGLHSRFQNTEKYWTDRGFTTLEAREKVSEKQNTLSLSSRIKKYGLRRGILEYFKFVRKTANRLRHGAENKNPFYEINNEIKRKSVLTIYRKVKKDFEKFTPKEIEKMVKDEFVSLMKEIRKGHASIQSLFFFSPVYHVLKDMGFTTLIGYDGGKEFKIYYEGKKFFRYDFCIPSLNLIFEFDGTMYHNSEAQIRKDALKQELAEKSGFKVVRLPASANSVDLCKRILSELQSRGICFDKKSLNSRFYKKIEDSFFTQK